MEDLSFSRLADERATWFDHGMSFDDAPEADTDTDARKTPLSAYRATSVLDRLSAHAAVFGCAAGCTAART